MIEAVENHMPQVIVVDEIGLVAEALAARTISQRGVQLIATAHGNHLSNLLQNPTLVELVGGISRVTLGMSFTRKHNVLLNPNPWDITKISMRSVWILKFAVHCVHSGILTV